ncbi:hypothetical protein [Labrenzia sp. DG1229]|uniref:hypothetical protein n=1 Tax=Labrenzia sp. DG1229 TaxID=681847 RepID=UPI0012EC222F|nr:hypothetical protein [Labrenzia sp. DG1229]
MIVFGSYILQQHVVLALQTGLHFGQRSGFVERAIEPWSFWTSILLFGSIGAGIVVAGLAYPVSMLLSWLRKGRREH